MTRQHPHVGRALSCRIPASIGGVVATTLGLVLALAASAAFSQTSPPTDAYGANAGAQFAEPRPSDLSSTLAGPTTRERAILRWNEIAIDATALDHTPAAAGRPAGLPRAVRPGPGGQGAGDRPHRRVRRRERGHRRLPELHRPSGACGSPPRERRHRAGRARHAGGALALADARPSTRARGRPRRVPATVTRSRRGIALGKRAAAAILARRADDGSAHPEPSSDVDFIPGHGPGRMAAGSDQPDPARPRRASGAR